MFKKKINDILMGVAISMLVLYFLCTAYFIWRVQ